MKVAIHVKNVGQNFSREDTWPWHWLPFMEMINQETNSFNLIVERREVKVCSFDHANVMRNDKWPDMSQ